jgi:hypothetical protein
VRGIVHEQRDLDPAPAAQKHQFGTQHILTKLGFQTQTQTQTQSQSPSGPLRRAPGMRRHVDQVPLQGATGDRNDSSNAV